MAFERPKRHRVELAVHAIGDAAVERLEVLPQHAVREHRERVAGVEGYRQPVAGVQRRSPATALAAVDDVVVDQERVVQHLDRDSDRKHIRVAAAEGPAGRRGTSVDRIALPGRLG